jgi:hypothetical protein
MHTECVESFRLTAKSRPHILRIKPMNSSTAPNSTAVALVNLAIKVEASISCQALIVEQLVSEADAVFQAEVVPRVYHAVIVAAHWFVQAAIACILYGRSCAQGYAAYNQAALDNAGFIGIMASSADHEIFVGMQRNLQSVHPHNQVLSNPLHSVSTVAKDSYDKVSSNGPIN